MSLHSTVVHIIMPTGRNFILDLVNGIILLTRNHIENKAWLTSFGLKISARVSLNSWYFF